MKDKDFVRKKSIVYLKLKCCIRNVLFFKRAIVEGKTRHRLELRLSMRSETLGLTSSTVK